MKKKLGLLIAGFMLLGVSAFGLTAPSHVYASGAEDVCAGLGAATGSSGCDAPAGSPTVEGTAQTVIRILSWVVGIISVIMVIVGGFQYVTSGGDSNKIGAAKNTIMYALIGVVIVVLAQVMVRFVIKQADRAPSCSATVTTGCVDANGVTR